MPKKHRNGSTRTKVANDAGTHKTNPNSNIDSGKANPDHSQVSKTSQPMMNGGNSLTNQVKQVSVPTIPLPTGKSYAEKAQNGLTESTNAVCNFRTSILKAALESFATNIKKCSNSEEEQMIQGMLNTILKVFD